MTVVEVTPGASFELGGTTISVGETNHRPVHPTVGYRIDDGEKSVVLGGDGIPVESLDAALPRRRRRTCRPCCGATSSNPFRSRCCRTSSTTTPRSRTRPRRPTRAGVGTLILTHYIPAMPPGAEAEWRALAEPHFAGTIVLGDDLTSVDL